MILLAPAFLAAAGLTALAVVGLHFLSTRNPKPDLFPTARFVPDLAIPATAATVRFQDQWLMLLRVFLILLVGTALARPQLKPAHRTVARIVAVDLSRAVGRPSELADSARGYVTGAAAVILFDTTAREVSRNPMDSLAAFVNAPRSFIGRGSLSSALIAAQRAGARVRDGADSLELIIVSPFAEEERDAATLAIRALWPGRIRTVRVSDAALPRPGPVVRVEWADSGSSALWVPRTTPDTITAARGGDAVMVYPFVRRWRPAHQPDGALRVYARWVDGEPAAFERVSATDCVRSIAIPLPTSGDAMLRPGFQRFLSGLDAPCGEPTALTPLPVAFMDRLRGDDPLAPASAVQRRESRATPVVPWLLGVAALVALFEIAVRRRLTSRRRGVSGVSSSARVAA